MRAMKLRKKRWPRIDERYARFRVRLNRWRIHRFGVFAAETIPAGRNVIEYAGERISSRESERRCRLALESLRKPLLYLFRLDEHTVIDGSVGGSGAEFVNHSCASNLHTVTEDGHIHYWSRRRIETGEELTVDYKYPRKVDDMRYKCGGPRCRRTINSR
jgi:SET domain-containing protein